MGEESATDTGTDVTVQTTRSRAVVPEKSGRRTGLLEKQKIGHDVPARTRRRQGSCRSRRNRDLRWTIPRRSRSSGSLAAFRFRGSGGRSGSTQRRHRPAAVRRCDHRRGTGCCREAAWHDPGRTDDEVPRSCEPGGPWRSRRRTAESFQGPWRKLRADSLPARTRANRSSVSSLFFQSPPRRPIADGRGIPALFRSRRLRIDTPHRSQLYRS